MNKSKKIKIISSVISCMGLATGFVINSNMYINNNVKILNKNAVGDTFNVTPEGGIEIKCTILTEPTADKNGTISVEKVDDRSGHLVIPELVTHNENNYDVTTIPTTAFSLFSGETYTGDLVIPRSITSIGLSAFNSDPLRTFTNSNLLVINSSTQNIPQYCFELCQFKNIRILSDTIERIDYACFANNLVISSIEIPPNIISIGEQAFANCTNLNEFILLSESFIPYVSNMLAMTKIESGEGKIYVKSNLVDQYKSATGWSDFAQSIEPLVESIALDQTNIKAHTDDQPIKLNTIVEGKYQDIIWSSSNESVTSVDQNGQLTYNNVGKAVITVESRTDSTKFATCEVEITEPEPQPEPEKPTNNLALILGLSLGLGIPVVVGIGFGTYYFVNKNKK